MLGKDVFSIFLLVAFVAITASIPLCHTDDGVIRDPYCPACNLQSSCVAIDTMEVFLPPDLTPAELPNSADSFDYSTVIIIGFPARPPPVV
jgi:hypothetical protein